MATVLVTGGSGTLGRQVVNRLLNRHHRTRILTRQITPIVDDRVEVITGNLIPGNGLSEAVAGIDAIIHCANISRTSPLQDSIEGTRSLIQAARSQGSPHLVYISIVGVDRSAYPYYAAKRATEELIERGPLSWTILRTTQFHDFVLQLIRSFDADTLPVVSVPDGVRFQSIDVGEVAGRLVALVEEGFAGYAPEMGGPQILTFEEMVEAYLRVRGSKATVRSELLPGELLDGFRSGNNLTPDHGVGVVTWEAFLTATRNN